MVHWSELKYSLVRGLALVIIYLTGRARGRGHAGAVRHLARKAWPGGVDHVVRFFFPNRPIELHWNIEGSYRDSLQGGCTWNREGILPGERVRDRKNVSARKCGVRFTGVASSVYLRSRQSEAGCKGGRRRMSGSWRGT